MKCLEAALKSADVAILDAAVRRSSASAWRAAQRGRWPHEGFATQRKPSDIEAIEGLVSAAYGKYIDRIGRKPKPMLANYHIALIEHQVWLCERKHVAVGVLEFIPRESYLLLENIAVSPILQGQGL